MFGRNKQTLYEKLLEIFNSLSEDEKAKFKAQMQDIDKAEDKREVDKIEEEKADSEEVKDEKKEEVDEESEEIGKKVDEAEEVGEKEQPSEEKAVEEEVTETPNEEMAEETEEPTTEVDDINEEKEAEKTQDNLDGLIARIAALEEKISALTAEDEKPADFGISGYGTQTKNGYDEDERAEDTIRKLGGRA